MDLGSSTHIYIQYLLYVYIYIYLFNTHRLRIFELILILIFSSIGTLASAVSTRCVRAVFSSEIQKQSCLLGSSSVMTVCNSLWYIACIIWQVHSLSSLSTPLTVELKTAQNTIADECFVLTAKNSLANVNLIPHKT